MILEELSKKGDILHTSCLYNVDLLIMIMMLRRMIMSKSSGWWWCRPIVDQSFGWWWWWGWWWMTPTNSRRVSQKGQRRKSSCSILSPSGSRDHHVQTASGFAMIVITIINIIVHIVIIIINIIGIRITIVGTCERLLAATFGNFASVLELSAWGLYTFGPDDQYHQVGNRKMVSQ